MKCRQRPWYAMESGASWPQAIRAGWIRKKRLPQLNPLQPDCSPVTSIRGRDPRPHEPALLRLNWSPSSRPAQDLRATTHQTRNPGARGEVNCYPQAPTRAGMNTTSM